MSTGLRISAFILALTAVFGLGFGLGTALDPVSPGKTADTEETTDLDELEQGAEMGEEAHES
jgi:hypothetical protein